MLIVKTIKPDSEDAPERALSWEIKPPGVYESDTLIHIKDTGNADYNFLLGIRGLIESYICQKDGTTAIEVAAFDDKFLEAQRAYPDILSKIYKPGDNPQAPQFSAHRVARGIEGILIRDLGVDLQAYDDAVNALDYKGNGEEA